MTNSNPGSSLHQSSDMRVSKGCCKDDEQKKQWEAMQGKKVDPQLLSGSGIPPDEN